MPSARFHPARSRAILAVACAVLALFGLVAVIAPPGESARAGEGIDDGAPASPRGRVFHADGTFPVVDRAAQRAWAERRGGGASAQAVIGPDDRVQLTDTHEYPLRAIALLEMYDDGGEFVGHCTGTFISPNAVLTAAHCLWSADTGWTYDIRVVPGRSGDFEPYDSEWGADWWVPDGWIESDTPEEYDWGVIKMPSNALGSTVGWFSIGILRADTLRQPDFRPAIIGYSGDKPFGTMWGDFQEAFLQVTDTTLIHDVDTYAGESGSAVFSLNSEKPYFGYIVGVHVRGGTKSNEASRADAFLLNDLLDGCESMGCDIDWDAETTPGEVVTPTPTRSATAAATATPTRTPTAAPTAPPRGGFQVRIPILAADR